jgi:hypothetical protein
VKRELEADHMSRHRRALFLVLWILSVLAAGAWGQGQEPPLIVRGQVVSGDDIGFRIDRKRGEVPVGVFVVRIDGKWVEAEFSPRLKPAK